MTFMNFDGFAKRIVAPLLRAYWTGSLLMQIKWEFPEGSDIACKCTMSK